MAARFEIHNAAFGRDATGYPHARHQTLITTTDTLTDAIDQAAAWPFGLVIDTTPAPDSPKMWTPRSRIPADA